MSLAQLSVEDVSSLSMLGLECDNECLGAKQIIENYVPFFNNLRAVIPEDNNDDGRNRTKRGGPYLYGTATSVEVIDFPAMPVHYDINDS